MTETVEIPIWLFFLILAFAVVTFASHFLFPSVRWFLRRRMERVVARINKRLERPIRPFKLARRHDMIQRLIYDPSVLEGIVAHARETETREDVAFEQARRYAREIVPSFSATVYFGFAIRAARKLATALYDVRLVHHDESALAKTEPEATIVYVINHRSNMDYVLVTYLAARQSALSYAVGEWARVWPLSGLIRSMGAFFIRRKARNDLYRRVLARYVALATQGGVTQAMFPEGGLSLDGALAVPRVGLLKYIVDGWSEDGQDVVFVPVALNYDRVLEDRVLIGAHESGERRFRARPVEVAAFVLRHIRKRIFGRFHRFGYAAVSFGEPVSLRAFAASKGRKPEALAANLMARISEVMPVLPVPVVAHVMRDGALRSRDEIGQIAAARFGPIALESEGDVPVIDAGLRRLVQRGLIVEDDATFRANPKEAAALAYYARSVDHLAHVDAAGA